MAGTKVAKNIWQLAKKEIFVILALGLILFLGDKLRSYNYATVPHPAETADEYNFAWAGLSLIKQGVPIGWTGIETGYKKIWYEKINVDGIFTEGPGKPIYKAFRLTEPWFDKPPGFALLVGTYSYLKGAREFVQTDVGIIRRLMLKIALVTTVLIFLVGTKLYNKWVGLLAALFYSVIPTTVVSSRLVLAENGYIPLFLVAILLMDYYIKKKKKIFLILASVLAAIAILFKLSGISVLLTLLLIVLAFGPPKEKLKDLILVFAIGISGLLAFFIYGAYYDWAVFKNVFFAQASLLYGAGAEVFISVLVRSKVTATKFLSDGWILAAWIATFIISFTEWKKEKGSTILTISLFSYLVTFLIFGSEGYGWYRFPFLPFIIIALARLIEKTFSEPNILVFLGIFLLPFGTGLHKLYGIEGFSKFVPALRIFLIFILSLFAGTIFINKRWMKNIYRLVFLAMLAFLVLLAIKEIHFFNINTWFYVT